MNTTQTRLTEDDTYLALRKATWDELRSALNLLPFEEYAKLIQDKSNKESFLRRLGWNSIEFDQKVGDLYS